MGAARTGVGVSMEQAWCGPSGTSARSVVRRIAEFVHPEQVVGEPGGCAGQSLEFRRVRSLVLRPVVATELVSAPSFHVPVTAMSHLVARRGSPADCCYSSPLSPDHALMGHRTTECSPALPYGPSPAGSPKCLGGHPGIPRPTSWCFESGSDPSPCVPTNGRHGPPARTSCWSPPPARRHPALTAGARGGCGRPADATFDQRCVVRVDVVGVQAGTPQELQRLARSGGAAEDCPVHADTGPALGIGGIEDHAQRRLDATSPAAARSLRHVGRGIRPPALFPACRGVDRWGCP